MPESTPRERIAAILKEEWSQRRFDFDTAADRILSELQAPRDECLRSSDGKHTLVAYGPHKGWCFDCGASPEAITASRAPAPQADALEVLREIVDRADLGHDADSVADPARSFLARALTEAPAPPTLDALADDLSAMLPEPGHGEPAYRVAPGVVEAMEELRAPPAGQEVRERLGRVLRETRWKMTPEDQADHVLALPEFAALATSPAGQPEAPHEQHAWGGDGGDRCIRCGAWFTVESALTWCTGRELRDRLMALADCWDAGSGLSGVRRCADELRAELHRDMDESGAAPNDLRLAGQQETTARLGCGMALPGGRCGEGGTYCNRCFAAAHPDRVTGPIAPPPAGQGEAPAEVREDGAPVATGRRCVVCGGPENQYCAMHTPPRATEAPGERERQPTLLDAWNAGYACCEGSGHGEFSEWVEAIGEGAAFPRVGAPERRLEAALEPFARLARQYDARVYPRDGDATPLGTTLGDCRRAAAALRSPEAPRPEKEEA